MENKMNFKEKFELLIQLPGFQWPELLQEFIQQNI